MRRFFDFLGKLVGKKYGCLDCGRYHFHSRIIYVTDFGRLICIDCLKGNPLYYDN